MTLGNPVNSSAFVASAANAAEAASNRQLNSLLPTGTDWAPVAASSPISTGNRFALFADGQTDGHFTDADEQPFTDVSRKNRSKRRRRESPQLIQQQQQRQSTASSQQQQQQQRQLNVRRSSRPVLVGKGSAAASDHGFGAAKKLVKKAVFCVDNVSSSCDVDDIRSFVTNMSIDVLFCFRAEPRRRQDDSRQAIQ